MTKATRRRRYQLTSKRSAFAQGATVSALVELRALRTAKIKPQASISKAWGNVAGSLRLSIKDHRDIDEKKPALKQLTRTS